MVDDIDHFKLNNIMTFTDVLNQKFELEKHQCDRNAGYKEDLCPNMVTINKSFPYSSVLSSNKPEYTMQISQGYRNKYTSFPTLHFCSQECLEYSKKYNRCERCHEGGKGTYVEELGYTLCNGRGDCSPPCIAKYRLEKRFKKEYVDAGFYEISPDIKYRLLNDCAELQEILRR